MSLLIDDLLGPPQLAENVTDAQGHLHDQVGKFAKKLAGLKKGEKAKLPDGTEVEHVDLHGQPGYAVFKSGPHAHGGSERNGAPKKEDAARTASETAHLYSAGKEHPKSFGGPEQHSDLKSAAAADLKLKQTKAAGDARMKAARTNELAQIERALKRPSTTAGHRKVLLARRETLIGDDSQVVHRGSGEKHGSTLDKPLPRKGQPGFGETQAKLARRSGRNRRVREEVGKPGTNWKQVTPANRKKVDPLVKHWMSKAKPFTECVAELAPEKGAEAAKRICAVVKDMGMRTTKWRSGGKKVKEAEQREMTRLLTESLERIVGVEEVFGRGAAEELARLTPEEETGRKLMEMCFSDLITVASLRSLVEGGALEEAAGDFDAAALLAKVKEAPRFREPSLSRQGPMPWTVLGPPDDPNIAIEPGGVIEDDRTRRQKGQGFNAGAEFAKAKATASAAKAAAKKAPSATPSGLTGSGSTPRERWAAWDKVNSGKTGAPVQGVQAAVGAKTDGVFGAKTLGKVKAFQQKNGLQVDGVVGRQTYAALAGRKGASGIKVGKLSHVQVRHLAAFSRHGGTLLHPRRRKLAASAEEAEVGSLQEAMLTEVERATHEEFPDRVKALKQGETARMPDGIAVRRASTVDGRDIFQVGEPSTYGDVPGDIRYYGSDHHRTADNAIADAGSRSARRADPESLGGESRFHRHTSARHGGQDVTFMGVDSKLQPRVRAAQDLSASPKVVKWGDLSGRPSLRESASGVADAPAPFCPSA